jgi:hypothetical protein
VSTSRSNRVKAVISTVTLSGAAMGWLTACGDGGNDNEAREVYCVDEQDRVVDDDQCEEAERHGGFVGGLPFFFLLGGFGGNRYGVGQTIPRQYTGAATRVNPSDSSARSRAGMPSTGKVASGTRISGGIGKGSVGGSGGS